MRDALKAALGADFKAAGCPCLCVNTETGGHGRMLRPQAFRPGYARERVQHRKLRMRRFGMRKGIDNAATAGCCQGRELDVTRLFPHLALANREMLKQC